MSTPLFQLTDENGSIESLISFDSVTLKPGQLIVAGRTSENQARIWTMNLINHENEQLATTLIKWLAKLILDGQFSETRPVPE